MLTITVIQNSLLSYPNQPRRLLRSRSSFWPRTTRISRVTAAANRNKSRLNKKAARNCQAACPDSTFQEWSIRSNLPMFSINDGVKVSATDGRPSNIITSTTTREIHSLYNITSPSPSPSPSPYTLMSTSTTTPFLNRVTLTPSYLHFGGLTTFFVRSFMKLDFVSFN